MVDCENHVDGFKFVTKTRAPFESRCEGLNEEEVETEFLQVQRPLIVVDLDNVKHTFYEELSLDVDWKSQTVVFDWNDSVCLRVSLQKLPSRLEMWWVCVETPFVRRYSIVLEDTLLGTIFCFYMGGGLDLTITLEQLFTGIDRWE